MVDVLVRHTKICFKIRGEDDLVCNFSSLVMKLLRCFSCLLGQKQWTVLNFLNFRGILINVLKMYKIEAKAVH